MHITLIAPGKLKSAALKTLYEEYKKRIDWQIEVYEELKPSLKIPFLITLDEQGEIISSREFSGLLQEIQLHFQGKVTFVIGNAEGLPQNIKDKPNKSISFGRLTWPHRFVRILLMEQLYRAQQILKNHPYHRA